MWYIIGFVILVGFIVLWSAVDDLKKADEYYPQIKESE